MSSVHNDQWQESNVSQILCSIVGVRNNVLSFTLSDCSTLLSSGNHFSDPPEAHPRDEYEINEEEPDDL